MEDISLTECARTGPPEGSARETATGRLSGVSVVLFLKKEREAPESSVKVCKASVGAVPERADSPTPGAADSPVPGTADALAPRAAAAMLGSGGTLSTTAAATSTTAAAAAASTTSAAAATTEAPTPGTTPTSTATPSASSTSSTTSPTTPSTTLAPLSLVVAASPTRGRRSPDLLSANQVDSSSRSNRGEKGDRGTPLKERVPFYRLFPYRTPSLPPPPDFLVPVPSPVDPLPPQVPAPLGVSQVDAVDPVEVTGDSGAAAGAEPGGADSGGAVRGGAEPGGAATGGAEPRGSGPGSATAEGAEPGGAELGGTVPGAAELGGAGSGGARSGAAEPGGATSGAVEPGVSPAAASRREPLSPPELREWFARCWRRASGAGAPEGVGAETTAVCPGGGSTTGAAGGPAAGGLGGAGVVTEGAGAVSAESGVAARPRPYFVPLLQQVLGLSPPVECPQPVQSQSLLEPSSPLRAPSPYAGPTGGLAERREPASRPVSPVRAARTSGRGSRLRPPPVPGTHRMSLRPSTAPLRAPLPSPPESSLPVLADPASDSLRAASPTVTRLLATVVTDPSFESTTPSALVAELVDFAARCRLDYAASLVSESASDCPLSVGGDCALGTDVLEDRQEELQCLAAASPHLASVLLAPEGDPDALDIPTPRSYAEAVEGPYSSQWQAAMDAEMASWKSTGTYVDAVPPPGANIVSGMWIFRVKRPPGSPPVFKARYVARGFSQRQGVDYFQTFSPTPKMTTLRLALLCFT
ncbi:unnamed protein product [Closterium sp. NIES-53]